MLDRYFITPRPQHVSVHHTEKRAPTDESVRLLREMEAAAKAQVVESLRLTSASVEAVAHRYENNMDMRTFVVIHYKVNGDKRECRAEIEYGAKLPDVVETIWRRLADDLAAYLLSGLHRSLQS